MKLQFSTMGMLATVNVTDKNSKEKDIKGVFSYFQHIDDLFSIYKPESEISRINNSLLLPKNASQEIQEVLELCDDAQKQTHGFFDIHRNDTIDPSGYVKGYAIHHGAEILKKKKYKNFYVEIAGDIEVAGKNEKGEKWRVGIENPFQKNEIIKVVALTNCGIATSGNYKQGQHIYNPKTKTSADDIISMTVIADNVEKADMLATACFAMGEKGIEFLEKLPGVEGYMVKKDKTVVMTNGFEKYVI